MVEVILPRSLGAILPGLPHRASVEGATVAEVVSALDARWPGVADRILEAGPAIREHINVYVDGDRAALETPVRVGSTVHVIPAVAGGEAIAGGDVASDLERADQHPGPVDRVWTEPEAAARLSRLLEAVAKLGALFSAADWEPAFDEALAELGRATGVRRVLRFERERGADGVVVASLKSEWASPGLAPLDHPILRGYAPFGLHDGLNRTTTTARPAYLVDRETASPRLREAMTTVGLESLLVVQVAIGDHITGALVLEDSNDRRWMEAEIEVLQAAAAFVGAAIAGRRASAVLARRDAILAGITVAAEHLVRGSGVNPDVHDILERLGRTTEADRVLLVRRSGEAQGDPQMTVHDEWVAPGITPLIGGPGGEVRPYFPRWRTEFEAGRLVAGLVRDFPPEERVHLERDGVGSIVVTPITVGGRWWGHVGCDRALAAEDWSDPEIDALRAAAGIIGATFDRHASALAIRQTGAILHAAGRAATLLLETRTPTSSLPEVLELLCDASGSRAAWVYRIVEGADGLSDKVLVGEHLTPDTSSLTAFGERLFLDPSTIARLRAGEVLRQDAGDSLPTAEQASMEALGIRSWIAVPIHVRRVLWGTFGLDSRIERHWSAGETDALAVAAGAIAAALERELGDVELATANEGLRMADRMEVVGRVAGSLAHDFGNLLTIIGGNAQLLVAEARHDVQREEASEIVEAAQRGSVLVRDLLSLSRARAGAVRAVDLGALVGRMSRIIERAAGSTVKVAYDLAASPDARADPSEFEHVLLNLVVNARDAMPDGGQLQIGLAPASRPDGEWIALGVTDTGTGMDATTRERALEPFFTTKPEGKGTGLGLATAAAVVGRGGGRIEIESTLGVGTRFTLLFRPA